MASDIDFRARRILDVIAMIEDYRLDIRTVTMGISLIGCARATMSATAEAVYDRVTERAARLVEVCEGIERELGIPIVNKRISVSPISLVAAELDGNPADIAASLDRAAAALGVNFVGGYSSLVEKGMTESDRRLIASIPEALATTSNVCGSVNVATSRAGINMDAVAQMGQVVKQAAELTAEESSIACAKLVVFANAVGDNPFMAGAFHGIEEPDTVVSVGVSGPVSSTMRSAHLRVPVSTRWPRKSRRRRSRSRAPDSWWEHWPRNVWVCPSASWTSPSPPPQRLAIPSPTSSSGWVWTRLEPTERPLRSRC